MGYVATGKIKEDTGIIEALGVVSKARLRAGILRILSKEISGRVSIADGQFITGGHLTSNGSRGLLAIRSLIGVNKGMYAYYEPDNSSEFDDLHEGLAVPLHELLQAGSLQAMESVVARQVGSIAGKSAGETLPLPGGFVASGGPGAFVGPAPLYEGQQNAQPGNFNQGQTPVRPDYNQPVPDPYPTSPAPEDYPTYSMPLRTDSGSVPRELIDTFSSHGRMPSAAGASQAIPPFPGSHIPEGPAAQPAPIPKPAPVPHPDAIPQSQSVQAASDPGLKIAEGESVLGRLVNTARTTINGVARRTFQGMQSLSQARPESPPPQALTAEEARVFQDLEASLAKGAQHAAGELARFDADGKPAFTGEQPLPQAAPQIAASGYRYVPPTGGSPVPPMPGEYSQPPSAMPPTQQGVGVGAPPVPSSAPSQASQFAPPAQGQSLPAPAGQPDQPGQPGQPGPSPNQNPHQAMAQPVQADGLVRKTAQKIASRLKMQEQKQKEEEQEQQRQKIEKSKERAQRAAQYQDRLENSQRLRSVELDGIGEDNSGGARKVDWRKDKATLMGLVVTVVVVGAVILCKILGDATGPEQHVKKAQDYLKQNKPELAATQLSMALQQKPSDTRALAMRADALQQVGDWSGAIADYDKLKSLDSNGITPEMGLKRGILLYRLKKYDEALAQSDQLLSANKDDKKLLTLKGMALSRTGKFKEALEALGEPAPDMVQMAEIDKAYALFNMKLLPQALELYGRAVEDSPMLAQPRTEKALVEVASGKLRDAISDLKAASDLDPKAGENFASLGDIYRKTQETNQAIKAYKQAVALDYQTGKMYSNIASCQMDLKLYSDADTSSQKALSLAADDKVARDIQQKLKSMSLAHAPAETGASGKTEGSTGTIDVKTAGSAQLVKEGQAALKRGAAEQAVEYLAAAVNKGASDTVTRLMLAHALMNSGDYKKAYQEFLSIQHNTALAPPDLLASGKCAIMSGARDDGINILKNCLAVRNTWMEARLELIKAYVSAGQSDKAQSCVQDGCKLAGTDYERNLYRAALTKK